MAWKRDIHRCHLVLDRDWYRDKALCAAIPAWQTTTTKNEETDERTDRANIVEIHVNVICRYQKLSISVVPCRSSSSPLFPDRFSQSNIKIFKLFQPKIAAKQNDTTDSLSYNNTFAMNHSKIQYALMHSIPHCENFALRF